ncbi:hypothetical protein KY331_00935 [Candidatus Woesearchaeota archaeon]|nr:hypothetical protein [Candidatus Woesearchaeota archaeon]
MSKRNMLTLPQMLKLSREVDDDVWAKDVFYVFNNELWEKMYDNVKPHPHRTIPLEKISFMNDSNPEQYRLVKPDHLVDAGIAPDTTNHNGTIAIFYGTVQDLEIALGYSRIDDFHLKNVSFPDKTNLHLGHVEVSHDGVLIGDYASRLTAITPLASNEELLAVKQRWEEISKIVENDRGAQKREAGYKKARQIIGE